MVSKPNLGSLRRRFTSLLTALTFLVLAVTGVLAFVRPFSLNIVGLHALLGRRSPAKRRRLANSHGAGRQGEL